jgi:hypothetical protein
VPTLFDTTDPFYDFFAPKDDFDYEFLLERKDESQNIYQLLSNNVFTLPVFIDLASRYGVRADSTPSIDEYNTDNTAAILLAISEAPPGATLVFPGGIDQYSAISTDTIPVNKAQCLRGEAQRGARLCPILGMTAGSYLIDIFRVDMQYTDTNHLYGIEIHDMFLDGGGRNQDIGGIQMDWMDRSFFSNLRICHFKREAMNFYASCRESYFSHIYMRNNGDKTRNLPTVNLTQQGTGEGHNNLFFDPCWSIASFGDHILCDEGTSTVRGIWWRGMIHGMAVSEGLPGFDGYPSNYYTNGFGSLSTMAFNLNGAHGPFFFDGRFNSSGYGQPYILIKNQGSVVLGDCYFGSLRHRELEGLVANAGTNAFTYEDHFFWTGARLQFVGADLPVPLVEATDYWVKYVDEDHFQVSTSLDNALAGTVIDLSDAGSGSIDIISQEFNVVLEDSGSTLQVGDTCKFGNAPERSNIGNFTGNASAVRAGMGVDWAVLDGRNPIETNITTSVHTGVGRLDMTGNSIIGILTALLEPGSAGAIALQVRIALDLDDDLLATVTADGVNTITVDSVADLSVGYFIDILNKTTGASVATNREITNIAGLVVTYDGDDETATTADGVYRHSDENNYQVSGNGVNSWGNGIDAPDTTLRRLSTHGLLTNRKMLATGGIGVGNSVAGATPGTVTRSIPIYNDAGAVLCYVAGYDAIAP